MWHWARMKAVSSKREQTNMTFIWFETGWSGSFDVEGSRFLSWMNGVTSVCPGSGSWRCRRTTSSHRGQSDHSSVSDAVTWHIRRLRGIGISADSEKKHQMSIANTELIPVWLSKTHWIWNRSQLKTQDTN